METLQHDRLTDRAAVVFGCMIAFPATPYALTGLVGLSAGYRSASAQSPSATKGVHNSHRDTKPTTNTGQPNRRRRQMRTAPIRIRINDDVGGRMSARPTAFRMNTVDP